MPGERYIVKTVECQHCKTKQKIHVAVRPGHTRMADESIQCINCNRRFNATVSDKIIRGPFPA